MFVIGVGGHREILSFKTRTVGFRYRDTFALRSHRGPDRRHCGTLAFRRIVPAMSLRRLDEKPYAGTGANDGRDKLGSPTLCCLVGSDGGGSGRGGKAGDQSSSNGDGDPFDLVTASR